MRYGARLRHAQRAWMAWVVGVSALLGIGQAAFAATVDGGSAPATDARPRLALGLIVKLKEARTTSTSVVRLQASKLPSDAASSQRLRMAAVAQRQRVSYTVDRPTAFAARLVHAGQLVSLSEARAQADLLRQDPDVEWVAVNEVLQPASVNPGSPHALAASVGGGASAYSRWLRARDASSQLNGVAGFETAWARLSGQSLSPVTVAVLDSGKLDAPSMVNRWLGGYDFVSQTAYSRDGDGIDSDPSDPGSYLTQAEFNGNKRRYSVDYGCEVRDSTWHGLQVASVLAGDEAGGDTSLAGALAPFSGFRVLPVRVAGTCGALTSDIIEGMLWAAGVDYQASPAANPHPARVISFSYGGSLGCNLSAEDHGPWLYQETITALRQKGAILLASAGNGDDDGVGLAALTRPAACPGVLAVTGLQMNGLKAPYANLADVSSGAVGGPVAVAVASGDVAQSVLEGIKTWLVVSGHGIGAVTNAGAQSPSATFYASENAGTSFSTPSVAAVVAMMLAVNPALTADEVMAAFRSGGATTSFDNLDGLPGLPSVCTGSSTSDETCVPRCDPGSVNKRGVCYCTSATCGPGILDADKAVAWAITQAVQNPRPAFEAPVVTASFFQPQRTQPDESGAGGGGALDALTLAGLLAVACLAGAARWQGIKAGRPQNSCPRAV